MKKTFNRKSPSECLPEELCQFKAIVLSGGQIQERGFDELIQAAEYLGFGFADGVLASVGAIKRPRTRYRNDIFWKAGSSYDPNGFELEFGWAHTLKEHEGCGLNSGIADILLEGVKKPIFATTGETNDAMKHIITKIGFRQEGHPYSGKTEMKVLFVRK
jgi:hypothetical protein